MRPIKHKFYGKECEFQIRGEHVWAFERGMGMSLFALLKRLTDGLWTFSDIAKILSFALHGPDSQMRMQMGVASMMGELPLSLRVHPDVVSALEKEGHGNFVELASQILSAAIFGEDSDGTA